ncbi:hypothetical protein BZA70DRAFT_304005 [Myxozyma melibiosi]|uniref:BAG domain-containing protein n=1 Tax=Myxozyma melibiosi TaxID=54550 RepID=A0ABR1F948_9ASCO
MSQHTFRHRPPSQTTALRRFFPIASRSLLAPPLLPLCSSDESSRSVCLSAQPPLTLSSPSAAASFAAAKAAALQAQLSQLSATLSLHKDSGIAALLCARERLLSSHFAQSLSKEYKQALVALSEASPLGLTFTVVAVLSGLALGTFAMRRFFGLDEPQSGRTSSPSSSSLFADASKPDHVLVKHGKQFLRVDFSKPGDISKGIATVGDVRATTARFLGVPKNDVILVYSGKKLRDDKDTLASHKMMSGSRMMCLVSSVQNAPPAAPARPMPQKPKKPTDPIEQINLVMDSAAKELVPMIDAFVAAPPNDHGDKHRMLSELILQRLFALDEVDTHENPEARKRRKEAVNKFHEYQARVDEANVGE